MKKLAEGYLSLADEKARLDRCNTENLCYVSLKPLGEVVGLLEHPGLKTSVRVLPQYVPGVVDKNS